MKLIIFSCFLLGFLSLSKAQCTTSATTVSGTHAPTGQICSGDLIFEDTFDEFDLELWDHEVTLNGGYNNEFQWYTNSRYNSYVEDGVLSIKPTLVSDDFGEAFLSSGNIYLHGDVPTNDCTNEAVYGCDKWGTPEYYLNPIKSARIRTVYSFNFKYGKVEVRAKLPAGDWLWPAIWMMPRYSQYAGWPASGEIDIMESRGNRDLTDGNGVNMGTHTVGSTLHWGPSSDNNGFLKTHVEKVGSEGYDLDFHTYQLTWDENGIQFSIDDEVLSRFEPPEGGFWEWGGFDSTGLGNPWKGSKSKMAPFDQKFYIIINLAVGGTTFFPDDANNPGGKPWSNSAVSAINDFWNGRDQWLPTWALEGDTAAFKIDYVRVWAI